jgi:hypothetical protein
VRAVLFDFAGWMEANNRTFNGFTARMTTPDERDSVAEWQGMPANWSKSGDLLIIRAGWVRQYMTLNTTERALLPVEGWPSIGMEGSD